eukprot:6346106-Amphidinium_carterae.1
MDRDYCQESSPSSHWDSPGCCQGEDGVHPLSLAHGVVLYHVASFGQTCYPEHPLQPPRLPCVPQGRVVVDRHDSHVRVSDEPQVLQPLDPQ